VSHIAKFQNQSLQLVGGVVAALPHIPAGCAINIVGEAGTVKAPQFVPTAAAAGSPPPPVHPVTRSPVTGSVRFAPATATHPIIPACHARTVAKLNQIGIVHAVAIAPAAPAAPAVAPDAFPQAPHPFAIATVWLAVVFGNTET